MNNSALEEALVKDFPKLYRSGYRANGRVHFNFACGDGWEPLIRQLSERLEALIDSEESEELFAIQVKEKFGGLRFYMSRATSPEMSDVIAEAEKRSYETCEKCGQPGLLRAGNWLKVLCDSCGGELPVYKSARE